MGAIHQDTGHGEVAVDMQNRLVTTPCYMLDARISQIFEDAQILVRELLKMTGHPA